MGHGVTIFRDPGFTGKNCRIPGFELWPGVGNCGEKFQEPGLHVMLGATILDKFDRIWDSVM